MVSEAADTVDAEDNVQVVVFSLGEEDLAFEINQVREIIKIPEITKVPNSSDYVEGVINLRGQIKAVLNLKRKLGMDDEKIDAGGMIIIAEKGDQTFGIIVDEVVGVFRVKNEDVTESPSILGGEKSDFIRGIGRMDDRLLIFLEPGRLFSTEEMAIS